MRASLPVCKSQSSKQWLARQFRDPYVQQRMASPAHYRSRSAFKLLELDTLHHFLDRPRPTSSRPRVIVDLGAAPGGWSQVAALKSGYTGHLRRDAEPANMQNYGLSQDAKIEVEGTWSDQVNIKTDTSPPVNSDDPPSPTIIAVDLLRMQPIPGVCTIQADFLSPTTADLIRASVPQDVGVDVLLSDMAANVTGNASTDAENSLRICQAVASFAEQHLTVKSEHGPGGVLVLKYFVHPDTQQFYRDYLLPSFKRVHRVKPPSSRSESSEAYWVCLNWLGGPVKKPRRPRLPPPVLPTEPWQVSIEGLPPLRQRDSPLQPLRPKPK
ncbi:23S ribosomal RNA methyltransferase [Ramaria rubella]|nr:23S ribosomal RNA methyltransferase [Ramaria rubella]